MIQVKKQVILAPFTTFGIGGPADYFVITTSQEDILEAVQFAQRKEIPYFVLGTGANILVGDKGFRGLVIKNEAQKITLSDNSPQSSIESSQSAVTIVTAESGATIEKVIQYTLDKGLSGLEHFAGIPSTVGGALWQNLHFLNPDRTETVYIGEIVEKAKILSNASKEVQVVQKDYFQFDYDYSILHDTKDIVLEVAFQCTSKPKEEIRQTIDANLAWRAEKHPENAGKISAGSIFKKIEGYGAGRLIQQVGLKGKQIGGAQISDKHANFIINTGEASARDVRALIDLVQENVKKELGLVIEPEITFVGEF